MTRSKINRRLFACAALAGGLLCAAPGTRAEYSGLWGADGKDWTPAGRLPDFSHAGYGAGDKAIPEAEVKADVKDFGAVGDGLADDTTAFIKAIASVEGGAVLIPAGRYKITGLLNITKPGLVLRGAGEDKTVLFFPLPLEKAVGPGEKYAPGQSWSWSGGFIAFTGRDRGGMLAKITAPARLA